MRKLAWLGLFALVAALATTPLASAQMPSMTPTATSVEVEPLPGPVEEGMVLVTKVEVTYTYVQPAAAVSPTEIHLKIVEAPDWIAAAISPTTLLVDVQYAPSAGGTTMTTTEVAYLSLALNGTLPDDVTGTVRVGAFAHPNGAMGASAGETTTLVTGVAAAATVPCDGSADPGAGEDDGGLATQTLGATPGPTLLPVAAAGVVGAVAGLGVARLKARRDE